MQFQALDRNRRISLDFLQVHKTIPLLSIQLPRALSTTSLRSMCPLHRVQITYIKVPKKYFKDWKVRFSGVRGLEMLRSWVVTLRSYVTGAFGADVCKLSVSSTSALSNAPAINSCLFEAKIACKNSKPTGVNDYRSLLLLLQGQTNSRIHSKASQSWGIWLHFSLEPPRAQTKGQIMEAMIKEHAMTKPS